MSKRAQRALEMWREREAAKDKPPKIKGKTMATYSVEKALEDWNASDKSIEEGARSTRLADMIRQKEDDLKRAQAEAALRRAEEYSRQQMEGWPPKQFVKVETTNEAWGGWGTEAVEIKPEQWEYYPSDMTFRPREAIRAKPKEPPKPDRMAWLEEAIKRAEESECLITIQLETKGVVVIGRAGDAYEAVTATWEMMNNSQLNVLLPLIEHVERVVNAFTKEEEAKCSSPSTSE